jgi:hypothetical protein
LSAPAGVSVCQTGEALTPLGNHSRLLPFPEQLLETSISRGDELGSMIKSSRPDAATCQTTTESPSLVQQDHAALITLKLTRSNKSSNASANDQHINSIFRWKGMIHSSPLIRPLDDLRSLLSKTYPFTVHSAHPVLSECLCTHIPNPTQFLPAFFANA